MIDSIIDKIHKALRELNEEQRKGHEVKRHWSPTDAGKCPRALWYAWMKFPKPPLTDEERKIFFIGNITHKALQKLLYTQDQLCDEFRIDQEWNGFEVAGFADSIIQTRDGIVLLDLKTISERGLPYVKGVPKDDHLKQVHLYMDVLGIKNGSVLYWSKEKGRMVEHRFIYNPEIIQLIIDLFTEVQECLDNGKLPKVNYDSKNWKCNYCGFAEYCKKNVDVLNK